jgi:hypothetical protein
MKRLKVKSMALKAMSEVRGGSSITHDTTILLSKKTRQALVSADDELEITGTVTIDKER